MESRSAENQTFDRRIKKRNKIDSLLLSLTSKNTVTVRDGNQEVYLNPEETNQDLLRQFKWKSAELNKCAQDYVKCVMDCETANIEEQDNQEVNNLNDKNEISYLRGLLQPEVWVVDVFDDSNLNYRDGNHVDNDADDESDARPLKELHPSLELRNINGASDQCGHDNDGDQNGENDDDDKGGHCNELEHGNDCDDDDMKKAKKSPGQNESWKSDADENNNYYQTAYLDVNNNISDNVGNLGHDKTANEISSTVAKLQNSTIDNFLENEKRDPSCISVTCHDQVSSLETSSKIQRNCQCRYCQRPFKHKIAFKYHEKLHREKAAKRDGKSSKGIPENDVGNTTKTSDENVTKGDLLTNLTKRTREKNKTVSNESCAKNGDEAIVEKNALPNKTQQNRGKTSKCMTNEYLTKNSKEASLENGTSDFRKKRKRRQIISEPMTNENPAKNSEVSAESGGFQCQKKRKRENKSHRNRKKISDVVTAKNDGAQYQKKGKRKNTSVSERGAASSVETNIRQRMRKESCTDSPLDKKKTVKSGKTEGVAETYACNFCEKTYINASHFNKHFAMHTGVNPYKCFCGKSFKTTAILDEHTKKQHPNYKPFVCDICGNKFRNQKQLKCHMYTHSELKKYKCSFCDYSSNKKSCLDCHVLTHTGVKPHVCSYCGRGFAKKWTLTDHLRTHTGVKPYKCNLCSAEFAQRNTLKNHMVSHSGEKNYQCPHCGVKIRRKTYLNQHIRDVCKIVGKKKKKKEIRRKKCEKNNPRKRVTKD